jgi:hypothetical protein
LKLFYQAGNWKMNILRTTLECRLSGQFETETITEQETCLQQDGDERTCKKDIRDEHFKQLKSMIFTVLGERKSYKLHSKMLHTE